MLDEILRLINDVPVETHFVWIASHLGIKGNVRADRLVQLKVL